MTYFSRTLTSTFWLIRLSSTTSIRSRRSATLCGRDSISSFRCRRTVSWLLRFIAILLYRSQFSSLRVGGTSTLSEREALPAASSRLTTVAPGDKMRSADACFSPSVARRLVCSVDGPRSPPFPCSSNPLWRVSPSPDRRQAYRLPFLGLAVPTVDD